MSNARETEDGKILISLFTTLKCCLVRDKMVFEGASLENSSSFGLLFLDTGSRKYVPPSLTLQHNQINYNVNNCLKTQFSSSKCVHGDLTNKHYLWLMSESTLFYPTDALRRFAPPGSSKN
jgi:hypothetical protein